MSAVGIPNVKVEMDPAGGASTASPSWVDITAYVRFQDGVDCSRGRTDERSDAQPGALSLAVNNSDGRFTPGLSSGAWHPLRIRCPIRVSFKPPGAGAYVVVWTGLVDSFAPSWIKGRRPVCRIRATDRLARLERRTFRHWESEQHLAAAPTLLWPLTEDAAAATLGELAAGDAGSILASEQVGSGGSIDVGAGALPVDAGTVLALTPADVSNGWRLAGTLTSIPGSTVSGMAISALVLTTVSTASTVFRVTSGSGSWLSVGVTATGKATAVAYDAATATTKTVAGAVGVCDGAWHQIGASVSTGGTLTLWVDGASDGTQSGAVSHAPTTVHVGGLAGGLYSGQVSHCALWAGQEPTTAMMTAAHEAVTGATGETSTARFTRVAAWCGLTATIAGTGLSTMGTQQINGKSAAAVLQECGEAELSVAYVSAAGAPALAARDQRYNAAVALTLDATEVGGDTDFATDDKYLVNDASAARPGGPKLRATNADSIDRYEAHTEDLTLCVDSDNLLQSLVQWRANWLADPQPRTDQLAVDAWAKQATVSLPDLVALDVGDRVQVTGLPATAAATTLDLFCEGVSDVFTESSWKRTVNVSPVGQSGAVWQLDDDTYSILDETTVLAV